MVGEVAFDVGEVFVGSDHAGGVELVGGYRGAEHGDAVECGLGGDLVVFAGDLHGGSCSAVR
jgi:hypothetical protein